MAAVAAAVLGLCAAIPAPGDDAAKQPGKFASDAAYARQRAAYARQATADVITRVTGYDDIVKDDVERVQKATEAHASLEEREAMAWDAGDEAAALRLRNQAEQANQDAEVWRRRLTEWRLRQGEAIPTEAQFQSRMSWMKPDLESDYYALIKAKRASAAAWGRVAEADYPGSDPARLYAAQDEAKAAEAEAEISLWRFNWAQQRSDILINSTPETPEVRQVLDEMRQLEDQKIQARRDVLEPERRARQAERELHLQEANLRKAAEAAREKRERELREQKEHAVGGKK